MLNPAIKLCLGQIEPGSLEKEVENLWENTIWTVFPAADHWMNQTKYKQGATEPDNKVMKLIHFNAGWAPIDVLVVELKRLREDTSINAFNQVASDLLDDHMAESTNPTGTRLFGAVGIGTHVQFYRRILPRGDLETTHERPLNFETDANEIQAFFNYFKENIPSSSAASVSNPSSSYEAGVSTTLAAPSNPSRSSGAGVLTTSVESSWAEGLEQYYYVQEGNYFFYNHGRRIPQSSRPKNSWVWNENGWSETGREKKWRFWDGKNITYK